jgi:hypothetical protein
MTTHRALGVLGPNRGRLLALVLIAFVAALATYLIATQLSSHDARSATSRLAGQHTKPHPTRKAIHSRATPTAAQFAVLLVTLSNLYGEQHKKPQRFRNADCVQASPGHYMCSYAVVRPGRAAECHLIQAEWTPNKASTFTVTLGGRVRRCGTLKEALASLK